MCPLIQGVIGGFHREVVRMYSHHIGLHCEVVNVLKDDKCEQLSRAFLPLGPLACHIIELALQLLGQQPPVEVFHFAFIHAVEDVRHIAEESFLRLMFQQAE